MEWILAFISTWNNQDNVDSILALQLTLTHKRQLSLALEEIEHKYFFIEMIKASELMTLEYFCCLIDFLYNELGFY